MQVKKNSNISKINQYITAKEVRLIDQDGNMIGVVSIEEALKFARDAGLDLVEVAHEATPSVCKILDYSKYKFEIKKKANEAKKKQRVITIKELKLRPNIGPGDYDVKMRNARGFIEKNNKVKVTLRFVGRELLHIDVGMKVLECFIKDTEDIAKLEVHPKREGNQLVMILTAK